MPPNDLSALRPVPSQPPFLLAADLDGTLLGDESGEAWLKSLAAKYPQHFRLAYITGRYRWSVLRLVEEGHLPPPHFICSDVGTELFDCGDPHNALGERYAAQVPAGWDLEALYATGEGPGVWRQDFPNGQPRFQAGFFWDGDPHTLADFRRRLAGFDHCHIQPSFGEYIDVFPLPLGKGNAARFLQRELGLAHDRVVVAGDSGNDLQMFETGFKGILPANALDELKAAAAQPWHYHSPYPAGRGVLDGLCHFGFLEPDPA